MYHRRLDSLTIHILLLISPMLISMSAGAADVWPLARKDAEATGATEQTLPESLEVLWEFEAEQSIETTPVIAEGRVFVGDVFGQLYAIGLGNGKELWRHDYDSGFLASPAIDGDLLVIGDVLGNVYAMDAATGKQRWKQTTEGEINGAAVFHKDRVLVASQDGSLYCFAKSDGKQIWAYQTNDQIRCTPSLASDRAFLGGCDGALHVVNMETGEAVGEPLPLGGPTGSTPVIQGDNAYVQTMDGMIFGFNWKDHEQLWSYTDPERAQEYRSSAALRGDRLIVSSRNKNVDAISTETGERLWRRTIRRRADASPVIAGEDVWIAATDGRLLRLALSDGTEKWQYEIRGSFVAAPAIAGDKLIIADDDGVVRCFGLRDTRSPPASP